MAEGYRTNDPCPCLPRFTPACRIPLGDTELRLPGLDQLGLAGCSPFSPICECGHLTSGPESARKRKTAAGRRG